MNEYKNKKKIKKIKNKVQAEIIHNRIRKSFMIIVVISMNMIEYIYSKKERK